MHAIPARMTYLRNAEAVCSFALPAIFCYDWQRSGDPVTWGMRGAALVLISYILLQGVLYWHLKLQSVVQRQPLPAYFQPLYRFFKYSNFLAIAAVAAFIAAMNDATTSTADLLWSYGLLTLAVLEQINYYHYQLMYDTRAAFAYLRRNGRLRKAALGLDLERQKAI
ncbi:hypothetical protein [Rugamonas rivuli]|uniref:Uncharacterized protein n=1 Tax=Rugamonas rivuli TaxID=2743358 RepID=A0A843SKE7_9BURK|nr:hypothetical protein [Rugamonas rivuli]MQA23742.1 hypothetical protein [Rugamonas rivuli]